MLRLTLTLIPKGNESKSEIIGEIEIVNDQTGYGELGNYDFQMKGILWARGRLENFIRSRGYWQCIKEVLNLIDMNKYE